MLHQAIKLYFSLIARSRRNREEILQDMGLSQDELNLLVQELRKAGVPLRFSEDGSQLILPENQISNLFYQEDDMLLQAFRLFFDTALKREKLEEMLRVRVLAEASYKSFPWGRIMGGDMESMEKLIEFAMQKERFISMNYHSTHGMIQEIMVVPQRILRLNEDPLLLYRHYFDDRSRNIRLDQIEELRLGPTLPVLLPELDVVLPSVAKEAFYGEGSLTQQRVEELDQPDLFRGRAVILDRYAVVQWLMGLDYVDILGPAMLVNLFLDQP